jgi:hypothetical protein
MRTCAPDSTSSRCRAERTDGYHEEPKNRRTEGRRITLQARLNSGSARSSCTNRSPSPVGSWQEALYGWSWLVVSCTTRLPTIVSTLVVRGSASGVTVKMSCERMARSCGVSIANALSQRVIGVLTAAGCGPGCVCASLMPGMTSPSARVDDTGRSRGLPPNDRRRANRLYSLAANQQRLGPGVRALSREHPRVDDGDVSRRLRA